MGCFSFMCKECDKPILSNSFRGQKVELFLLKNSEIIEKLSGEYSSYGTVFDKNGKKMIEWKMEWGNVCDLMFSENNGNGISAIHSKCYKKDPITISDNDPNQGWGEEGELMGDISDTEIL